MTTLFSDNFNRADNASLGSNWLEKTTNDGSISSNRLKVADSGNSGWVYTTTTAHAAVADCKVSVTRLTGSGFDGGPLLRKQSGETFYYLDVSGTTTMDVYRRDSGVDTAIGSCPASHAINDVYRLECSGAGATVTLKVFKNNVQAGSDLTDNTAGRLTTAGQTGALSWVGVSGVLFDDFLVEDLGSVVAGALTMAGTGAFSGVGVTLRSGAMSGAGTGALAAVGVTLRSGALTAAGTGTFSAAGTGLKDGALTAAGTGALAISGLAVKDATASFSGAGALSIAGRAVNDRAVTLSAAGSFAAVSDSGDGVATFPGSGALNLVGESTGASTFAGAGTGSLAAQGMALRTATWSAAGSAALALDGASVAESVAAFTGSGSLEAVSETGGQFTATGQGAFLPIGASIAAGVGAFAGIGSALFVGSVFVATPPIRVVRPEAEDRTLHVAGESRTTTIAGESRVVTPE